MIIQDEQEHSHFGNVTLADLEDIFSRLLFKQIRQI